MSEQNTPQEPQEPALDALKDPEAPPATDEPDEAETPAADGMIVGLGGNPIQVPRGQWKALVTPEGDLAADEDGRLIRVR